MEASAIITPARRGTISDFVAGGICNSGNADRFEIGAMAARKFTAIGFQFCAAP